MWCPPALQGRIVRAMAFVLLLSLGACSSGPRYGGSAEAYRAPGPPDDPWGPYISEASTRFGLPDPWIRAVIQQESGGRAYLNGQPTTSDAGAMGLMQLMPDTYADMQTQYGLGSDPYDPHDNILAGTAYLRQMYDRYGAPGCLAAYNAGPARVDDYLETGRPLPNETINYVASIAPALGTSASLSGPLAAYASAPEALAEQSEVAAAPPTPAPAAPPATSVAAEMSALNATPHGCNTNAAYDTVASCPESDPADRDPPSPALQPAIYSPPPSGGGYAVQVGAFGSPDRARQAAGTAQQTDSSRLLATRLVVQQTASAGGNPLWRARLAGMDRMTAGNACRTLTARGIACVIIPPGE
ncbi:lytic transglycosylase domain-containing protein [Acidomonas methanolica]|uniref:lytic transglycosylase domain-containing protein n=1 Tax=Acidomonas methanolica TaxID=437 RepID=UPI00211A7143|nr:lytic transglycosylase domain-containing protein [Acidomonas methanolica]